MRSCQLFQSHLLYWVLTYFTVHTKIEISANSFHLVSRVDEQDLGDIFGKSPLSDYFSSLLFLCYLPSNSRSLDSEPYLDIEYIVK